MIAEAERETMQMNMAVEQTLETDVMKLDQANTQIN